MNNWTEFSLGELCAVVNGGTPSTFVSEFWDGCIPWATPTDITACKGRLLHITSRNISQSGLLHATGNLLPKGTLLLCSRATVGDIRISPMEISFNQGFKGLIANEDKVHGIFLYYLLSTKRKEFEKISSGSTFLEFSREATCKFTIQIPSLAEQHRIAAILTNLDDLIEAQEALIAKKKEIKQATMEFLLTGKRRLPGFSGEWNKTSLSSCANLKSGLTISEKQFSFDGEYPCYGGNGYRGMTSTYTHSGKFVLIGRQGALCGNTRQVDGTFFASEHAIVCTPNHNVNPTWLRFQIERLNLNKYTESSAQPGLSVRKVQKFKIPLPGLKEQDAISDILSQIESELSQMTQSLSKLSEQKLAVMNKLLTGEIRVPDFGTTDAQAN